MSGFNEHRFLRVKCGSLTGSGYSSDNKVNIKFKHCDVDKMNIRTVIILGIIVLCQSIGFSTHEQGSHQYYP